MADAMLPKEKASGGKKATKVATDKGKKPVKKNDDEPEKDSARPSTSTSVVPNVTRTESSDPRAPGSDVSMTQVMNVLLNIQKEQSEQRKEIAGLTQQVNELYEEQPYEQDEYYDENLNYDDEATGTGDNNNNNVNDETDSVVEAPPSKKQKTDSDNSFKAAASKYQSKEKTCEKVNDDLADMVNTFFREGISDDKYQDLMKSTLRPENCTSLTRTKVNQVIWNWLSPRTQAIDVSLQQHQFMVIKAAIKLVQMLDKLDNIKTSEDKSNLVHDLQEVIDTGLDSIGLLAQYNCKTNLKRKEIQKPDLQPEYYHLCSQNVHFTEQLYGDEIGKEVKEIQDINRVAKKISANSSFGGRGSRGIRRGRGYGYGRYSRGRGRARGSRGRGRYSTYTTDQSHRQQSKNSTSQQN